MAQRPGRKAKSQSAPSPDDIRQRAYQIWEEEGWPHGRAAEHWSRAEREIAEIAEARPERSAVASPKPRKPAASAKGRKK